MLGAGTIEGSNLLCSQEMGPREGQDHSPVWLLLQLRKGPSGPPARFNFSDNNIKCMI